MFADCFMHMVTIASFKAQLNSVSVTFVQGSCISIWKNMILDRNFIIYGRPM